MIANDSVSDQTGSSSTSLPVSVSISNGSASITSSPKPTLPTHSGNGHAVIEIPVEVLLVASVDDDDDDDDNDKTERARGGPGYRLPPMATTSTTERRHRRTRQQRSIPHSLISGPTLPPASASPAVHEQLLSPLSELEESTSGSTSSGESTTGSSSDDDEDEECWVEAETIGACTGSEYRSDVASAFERRGTNSSLDPSGVTKFIGDEPCNNCLSADDDDRNFVKLRQAGNGLMSSDDVDQFFDVEPSSFSDEPDSPAVRLCNSHMTSHEACGYSYTAARTNTPDSFDVVVGATGSASGSGGVVRSAKSSSRDPLMSAQGSAGITTRLGHLFNSAVMEAHRQLGRG